MANYSIKANISSAFKPFTYDELTKPLVAYRQEEDRRQKAYLDMQQKSASLDDLNGYDKDAKYYNKYQAYKQQLNDVVDDMMHNGLTLGNNRAFQLYNTYNQEILPIKNLMDKRNELIQEQRKLGQDTDNMFTVNYANASLDDVRANKGMYRTINGKTLYQMGKELAVSASSRKEGIGRLNTEDKNTLAALYFYIRQGYGADAALNFLKNNANIPELADAVQRIQASAGTNQLQNRFDLQRANDYIINGIMAGLTLESKTLENKNFTSDEALSRLALALSALKLLEKQLNWQMSKPEIIQGADGNIYSVSNTVDNNGNVTGTTVTDEQDITPISGNKNPVSMTPRQLAQLRLEGLQTLSSSPRYGRRGLFGYLKVLDLDEGDGNYGGNMITGGDRLESWDELSPESKRNVLEGLAQYGVTEEDMKKGVVKIYVDSDWWNDNHYKYVVDSLKLLELQQKYTAGDYNSIIGNAASSTSDTSTSDATDSEDLDFSD